MTEIISAVIGAVIGFIASWFTLKYNYHKLFAETVSKNRMEWINVWRENISQFLSAAEVLHQMYIVGEINQNKDFYNILNTFYNSRTMISTRLNLNEDLHKTLYLAISAVDYRAENLEEQCVCIEEMARQILKPEWERVKREARGKNK